MASIFEVQADKKYLEQRLADLMYESDGEITEENEDEVHKIQKELEFTEDNFLSKVDSTIAFIREQESNVDAITNEIKRLTKLKKITKNSIERNKANVSYAMNNFGFEKLDRVTYKLSLRTSTPAPEIYGQIPEEYITTEVIEKEVVNNAAVKKFLLENGPQEWGAPVVKSNLQIK